MATSTRNTRISCSNLPFALSDADKETLSQSDEEFKRVTWEQLKAVIAANDLSILPRKPSDIRNYLLWTYETKSHFGSIADYVMKERLHWENFLVSSSIPNSYIFNHNSSTPFSDSSDYKILRNDWPYGVTLDITHLVIWSKTPIAVTEEGDPTPESREVIEDFIERNFVSRVGEGRREDDRVVWFKNRVQWQSVRALEHIHVLVRGAGEELVEEWTGQKEVDITARKWKPKVVLVV